MNLNPFKMGGSSGGLKCTITPGRGSLNSWAWRAGIGPKVLTRKANKMTKDGHGLQNRPRHDPFF